jgi:hypothetical protein
MSCRRFMRLESLAFFITLALALASCGGSSSSSNSGTSTPAPTASITATPATITAGQSSMLTFSSTNATSGSINNGVGVVGPNDSSGISVSPIQTTTYILTVTGPGGTATSQTTVTVNPAPPVSVTLSATPTAMLAGVPVTLSWTSKNATSVVITASTGTSPGGVQPLASGSVTLPAVSQTTTFTATASGVNGQQPATATTTVNVNPITSFEGLTADLVEGGTDEDDMDPNGAVGTVQFMEYVNTSYQAYSKTAPYTPVWPSPQSIGTPWDEVNAPHCADPKIQLDAVIIFDRLASRWVIAAKTSVENEYYFCIALSNTDDLTSPTFAWYTYYFDISSYLKIPPADTSTYLPDWPKIGTWWNGYYAAMDMVNVSNSAQTENGALICAFNRTSMLTGYLSGSSDDQSLMVCQAFEGPAAGGYLEHSLIPADADGTTAPPTGRDEYMVSIQNPPLDGVTTTSSVINLWDCQLSWGPPASLSCANTQPAVQTYTPGCYNVSSPALTNCVPEPGLPAPIGGLSVDSVGDRLMPRFAYRNFGSYESFLVSHTILTGPANADCSTNCQDDDQTGIRWYEFLGNGTGTPVLSQQGTISPDTTTFRFLPSIAQDGAGNVVAGYSTSEPVANPGINVSYWNLDDPNGPATSPTEVTILTSEGEEVPFDPTTLGVINAGQWGSYASMTVDPADDCTFWYTNEYWPTTVLTGEPASWATNIAYFQIPGCQSSASGSVKERKPAR